MKCSTSLGYTAVITGDFEFDMFRSFGLCSERLKLQRYTVCPSTTVQYDTFTKYRRRTLRNETTGHTSMSSTKYIKDEYTKYSSNIPRLSTQNKTLARTSSVRLAGCGFDPWPVHPSKRLSPKTVKMETIASLLGTQYLRLDLGG